VTRAGLAWSAAAALGAPFCCVCRKLVEGDEYFYVPTSSARTVWVLCSLECAETFRAEPPGRVRPLYECWDGRGGKPAPPARPGEFRIRWEPWPLDEAVSGIPPASSGKGR